MAEDDVLAQVLRAAHAEEGFEIRTFEVQRGGRQIEVRLLDSGPGHSWGRYMVELRYPTEPPGDSPYSMGNPDTTIQGALRNAHWEEFND